jgi:hypothetical protein
MKESLSVAPQKETLEDTNMLSYEDFKYNPEGETPQEKQPFNNFYFYFLDEDAGGMFYDIYREKEWFKKFQEENSELLESATHTITNIQKNDAVDQSEKLQDMSDALYEVYKIARKYASDEELFQ